LTEIVESTVKILSVDEAGKYITTDNESSPRYNQTIVIINDQILIADLAVTPKERELGLSIKKNMSENEAMLFVFDDESAHTFWMKGMHFSIDILWIDSDKRVVSIEHSLPPCKSDGECATYTPSADSLYVLETTSGFANKYHIEVGSKVRLVDCQSSSSSLCDKNL